MQVGRIIPAGLPIPFRHGGINFRFKLDGSVEEANWCIGERDDTMRVTYALPGWIRIEQELIKNEEIAPLVFKFPPIFKAEQGFLSAIMVNAINKNTKKPCPDWWAMLRFNTVQGDLTLASKII